LPAHRRPGQAAKLRAGHSAALAAALAAAAPADEAPAGDAPAAGAPPGDAAPGDAPAAIMACTARRARRATSGATFTSSPPSRRHLSRGAGGVIFLNRR